jgi:hypothetical protein
MMWILCPFGVGQVYTSIMSAFSGESADYASACPRLPRQALVLRRDFPRINLDDPAAAQHRDLISSPSVHVDSLFHCRAHRSIDCRAIRESLG